METDTEYWDGMYVEFYGEAQVLVKEGLHVDPSELFRELRLEMKQQGYVPIAGTEDVEFLSKPIEAGQTIKIEYSMRGKWYGPEAVKLDYVTESGERVWRNTKRSKSEGLSTT